MNHSLLCKFEVSRVEQILAARLNQEVVDLLTVNPFNSSKLTGPEKMALRQFVELARTLLAAPIINVEQVNSLVHMAGSLIASLARPRRKQASPQGHQPIFGSLEWLDDLDDYALARAGMRTGTCYDAIARNMRGE